jgi:hypothetical protein
MLTEWQAGIAVGVVLFVGAFVAYLAVTSKRNDDSD